MGNVYFTSDLHLGHKNIGKFRKFPKDILERAEKLAKAPGESRTAGCIANEIWVISQWCNRVNERDTVYCLGDTCFNRESVALLADLPGKKIQFGGNHDDLNIKEYMMAFDNIRGCMKHSNIGWLSHFPLHPLELRGKFSIHGHVHYATIDDYRYINVCCDNLYEQTGKALISLEELRQVLAKRKESNKVEYYD